MKKKPVYQPPEQPVKKKRRVWLYVIGALLAVGLIGNLINPNSSSSIPTTSPTPDGAERNYIVSEVSVPAEPTFSPTPTPSPTATPTPTPVLVEPTEDPVIYVWIPSSGSKYHQYSGCSNMDNPQKVTLDEAKAMGYTACKRCY